MKYDCELCDVTTQSYVKIYKINIGSMRLCAPCVCVSFLSSLRVFPTAGRLQRFAMRISRFFVTRRIMSANVDTANVFEVKMRFEEVGFGRLKRRL